MGIENVAYVLSTRQISMNGKLTMTRIMSDSQQNLIRLAKVSAQRHLSIILSNPELYIATFRYGMDFVWGM